ncbi:hypothetical protein C8R47DRAFT_1225847 [Mycena vitilis]|nr:hypothetical protein C8R47DRAFT_1225847 [Mycena vitilis]
MPPPPLINEVSYRTQAYSRRLTPALSADTIVELVQLLTCSYTPKFNRDDVDFCQIEFEIWMVEVSQACEFNSTRPGFNCRGYIQSAQQRRLVSHWDWEWEWDGPGTTDELNLTRTGLDSSGGVISSIARLSFDIDTNPLIWVNSRVQGRFDSIIILPAFN